MTHIDETQFGQTADGTPVQLFTLTNSRGMTVKITNYGVIITELHVPDRNGHSGNVVLGFDQLEEYLKGHPFFGAIAGRVANRIAKGRFTLDGKEYTLVINNGPNHLHGGKKGFDKAVWQAKPLPATDAAATVEFSHFSPDGDEGYPGNLSLTVTYTLTEQNELRIDYRATTDQATPLNVTNHSYFNLAGAGSVLDTELTLMADHYTPADATLIPTGEIASVAGTALDFTQPRRLGDRIAEVMSFAKGYDHNFVLNDGGKSLALAACAYEPKSGRVLEVLTTEPGVQLYTANHLNGSRTSVGGLPCLPHSGFCLETQHYPDSINHPNFPSVVLRPGQTFQSTTIFRFSTRPL